MDLKEFIEKTNTPNKGWCVRTMLILKSGLKLSVQASENHYSIPRKDSDFYTAFEVGYPTKKIKELLKFADDKKNPTGTVYSYVPFEVIEKIIKDNKGIDVEKTFEKFNQTNFKPY